MNVLVFSSCQSVLTSGVSIHMAATSLTMLCLAWDLETNLLTSLCSFIFALLICPDPAVSCAGSKHNKEDLSADTTRNVCRDDVHDRAPVYQGLLSVSFPTLLRSRVSLLLVCCSLHLHCVCVWEQGTARRKRIRALELVILMVPCASTVAPGLWSSPSSSEITSSSATSSK